MPGLTSPIPYPWLAWLCLAIVGINTLLVAAHALGEALRHLAARRALGDVRAGVAKSGLGEGGALATHEVTQLGRALDAKLPAIAFTDKSFGATLHGGEVEVDGAVLRLEAAPDAQVWPLAARQRDARAQPDDATFDAKARGARGVTYVVRTHVAKGDRVWLAGTRDGETFRATAVALMDPRAFHSGAALRELLFALVAVAVLAALAAVALVPPAFGLVSTLGGVALLAYFLLVQPAGVALEEVLRPPPVAFLRGEWRRATAGPQTKPATA